MPDHIADKGKAICISTAYFFERLEELGIKTHYIGVVEDGKVKKIDELNKPQDTLKFKLFRVIKPEIKDIFYVYSQKEKTNFLIPLEIIYRNSLPQGSSVFKRLKNGDLRLEDLGLKTMPVPGQILDRPIIDISTKFEKIDRYINWEKAKEICNLSKDDINEMKKITLIIDKLITQKTKKIGLFNEDGKIEFGFDENRNLIVVDSIGTLDESRFTYNGMPVSKEIARIFYRKTDWYKEIEKAKKMDEINWKKLVKTQPKALPKELLNSISHIYRAYTNELTGRKWFDSPNLNKVINHVW